MYLIELIVKWINPKKKYYSKRNFEPFGEDELEDSGICEHIFQPIDSDGEVLACRNCGLVVNKKDLKEVNIFKK